jgi:pilus assembly protein CpaF
MAAGRPENRPASLEGNAAVDSLTDLLNDPSCDLIAIAGPGTAAVRRAGEMALANLSLDSLADIVSAVNTALAPHQLALDPSQPFFEAQLPGGWQVDAVLPPAAPEGPVVFFQRASSEVAGEEQHRQGSAMIGVASTFLQACVAGRANIVVGGNDRKACRVLLNALANLIPPTERVVSVAWQPAFYLTLPQHVALVYTPLPGQPDREMAFRALVWKARRLNPDRILIDELAGGETLDLLHAMKGGFGGSMAGIIAGSPRDALHRMEMQCYLAGATSSPYLTVRSLIDTAVDLIVQVNRFSDGVSRVTHITEVNGMSGDVNTMIDIFSFQQTGVLEGRVQGDLRPTGIRPILMMRLEEAGIRLPPEVFGAGQRRGL